MAEKQFLCPLVVSRKAGDTEQAGGRPCPAKDKSADWRCPLALNDECALWVIAYNIHSKS